MSESLIALLTVIVTALGNKIWNRIDSKAKTRLEAAFKTMRALMDQVVTTSGDHTSMASLIVTLKGLAAVQLAKVSTKLKIDDPMIAPLVEEIIATAVQKWVAAHPAPKTLRPPIVDKVTAALAK